MKAMQLRMFASHHQIKSTPKVCLPSMQLTMENLLHLPETWHKHDKVRHTCPSARLPGLIRRHGGIPPGIKYKTIPVFWIVKCRELPSNKEKNIGKTTQLENDMHNFK